MYNPRRWRNDPLLTAYSLAYLQDPARFQAGRIFTVMPVEAQSGEIATFPKEYFMQADLDIRPMGQGAFETTVDVVPVTYACQEYSKQLVVDRRMTAQGANAVAQALESAKGVTRMLVNNGLTFREKTWADRFFKTGVWTTDWTGVNSGASTNQFIRFDQASATPIATTRAAMKAVEDATGLRPNTVVMGVDVYEAIVNGAELKGMYVYSQGGVPTKQNIADALEISVDRLFVLGAVQVTSKIGASSVTTARVANRKGMWVGYVDPNPAPMVPTAGAIFAWTGLLPGATTEDGGIIERWYSQERASDIVRYTAAWGMEQIGADLGIFLDQCVA
ncbi:hypothetical protein [Deinococcus misasensis]|uniref:hypothetical protein n=1 Tax=Deinococcus misasensis TaxID=392413 RepID=UPI000553F517|nr:hypothetical protein [Deinococcus misasensis]